MIAGVIKCPVTDDVRDKLADTFQIVKMSSDNNSKGFIYLRGVDLLGVMLTKRYNDDTTNVWVLPPELNHPALEKHGIADVDLLGEMICDGFYTCGGNHIKLDSEDSILYTKMQQMSDFTFTKTSDGIIGQVFCEKDKPAAYVESSAILETCMTSIKECWALDVLDPFAIAEIRDKVTNFMLTRKGDFMKLYDYAEVHWANRLIKPQYQVARILSDYEEYFNDLTNYIKSMVNTDARETKTPKEDSVCKAIDIDKNFRDKLYGDRTEVLAINAVKDMDAFIQLKAFLDNVYDSFIAINGISKNTGVDVGALINLYGYSISSFLKWFIPVLFEEFDYLCEFMVSKTVNAPIEGVYQLI